MDGVFLAGRVLFVVIFVLSGFGHFRMHEMMVDYSRQHKVPAPGLMVPLTGVTILAGGLGVALGVWGDLAALLLAAFLIPTAFFMHRFWGVDEQAAVMQRPHFLKNISLAGGALVLFYLFGELDKEAPLTLTGALFF